MFSDFCFIITTFTTDMTICAWVYCKSDISLNLQLPGKSDNMVLAILHLQCFIQESIHLSNIYVSAIIFHTGIFYSCISTATTDIPAKCELHSVIHFLELVLQKLYLNAHASTSCLLFRFGIHKFNPQFICSPKITQRSWFLFTELTSTMNSPSSITHHVMDVGSYFLKFLTPFSYKIIARNIFCKTIHNL